MLGIQFTDGLQVRTVSCSLPPQPRGEAPPHAQGNRHPLLRRHRRIPASVGARTRAGYSYKRYKLTHATISAPSRRVESRLDGLLEAGRIHRETWE